MINKGLVKGCKLAEKFHNKVVRERDTKGYRENLGYDLIQKFKEDLDKIIDQSEHYNDYCICVNYYTNLCDKL